jgi:Bacterial pre-peptidase C-terminal domain
MVLDRVGNTFRSSKNLGLLSTAKTFRDLVGNGDRSDIYRFQLNRSSNINIQLTRLGANADIALFNTRGQVIARSTRPSKRAELIQRPLATGVHYVRVTPRSRRDTTRYVLSLTATPVSNTSVPPTPAPTPTPTPSPTPTPTPSPTSPFNIQFDYRFDTTGWFTPERRQVLEASASIWENLILDEFPDTPVGTLVRRFANPQTGLNVDNFANDGVIDDVLIFVGARELGGIVGATLARSGPALVTSGTPRYTSGDFEPWIGTMAFDRTTNWFFDRYS